ncbi:hypothetical protein Patl1_20349 [Pistacia atlantica]|uniref:Uncharacterized protein n=1 Tax=Pistacia atlantica TaxID=434234 RepID=A0ACC1BN38_9ROSI|nr:hypothetical protein Patl1_20349 [Pistacia atlantica]
MVCSASRSTPTNGSTDKNLSSRSSSDVPAPPINTAVGGKASLQPKRTPVSEKEIEAILGQGVKHQTGFDIVSVHSSLDFRFIVVWEVASDLRIGMLY